MEDGSMKWLTTVSISLLLNNKFNKINGKFQRERKACKQNEMIYNLIWFANEDNLYQINIYESSYLSENNLV